MNVEEGISVLQEVFKDKSIDNTLKFLEGLNVKEVMSKNSLKAWYDEMCKTIQRVECSEEHRTISLEVAKKLRDLPIKIVMWLRVSVIYILTKAKKMGVESIGDTYSDNTNNRLEEYRKAVRTVFFNIRHNLISGKEVCFLTWDEECPAKESKYYDYIGFIIAKHRYLIEYKVSLNILSFLDNLF